MASAKVLQELVIGPVIFGVVDAVTLQMHFSVVVQADDRGGPGGSLRVLVGISVQDEQ